MATGPRPRPAAPRGPARLLRGWAAALVAVLLAAGSHTLAMVAEGPAGHTALHDAGPAPVVWILTLALAGPLCTALVGRRWAGWRLAAAVGASQLLFHGLYSMAAPVAGGAGRSAAEGLAWAAAHSGHGGHGGHGGPGSHAGHGVHPGLGAGAGVGSEPAAGLAATHGAEHLASPGMVAAHVLAAVATVLVLRHGEAALSRILTLAAGFVLGAPAVRLALWAPAPSLRPVRRVVASLLPRPQEALLSSLLRRGPPSVLRAA